MQVGESSKMMRACQDLRGKTAVAALFKKFQFKLQHLQSTSRIRRYKIHPHEEL